MESGALVRERALRIREAIKEEVSDIIQRKLKDPRIGMASVTRAEVSDDLRHARIFVSCLGGAERLAEALAGLESARGLIRGELGRRLRLRFAPEIAFVPDRSMEHAQRVAEILARVKAEEQAPRPGRGERADRAAVVRCLKEGRTFLVILHVRPDGDSIGSSLALGLALRKLGKEVTLVRADEIPANMAFLPGVERFVPWQEVRGDHDVAVLLDCGDQGRIGAAGELLGRARTVLNIDHHLSNACYGDVNYIEPEAAAAGEVLYRILGDLGVELDEAIATALYVAIATDTGSFRYENTSAETHEIAAELLRRGVRPGEVGRRVWEERPVSSLRLLERALARLEVSGDGLAAWTELTREDFARAGAAPWESEGVVNYPRTLRGVEVAALFIEEAAPGPEGPGEVKVSLRSNAWVDVSRIAAVFGGGGHARAAGCTVPGALAEVKERVLAEVRAALARGPER